MIVRDGSSAFRFTPAGSRAADSVGPEPLAVVGRRVAVPSDETSPGHRRGTATPPCGSTCAGRPAAGGVVQRRRQGSAVTTGDQRSLWAHSGLCRSAAKARPSTRPGTSRRRRGSSTRCCRPATPRSTCTGW